MAALIIAPAIMAQEAGAAVDNIYGFTVSTIDEEEQSLEAYKGKVLLIVNTASRCGFTPQYAGLEALHKRYEDQGFSVLGFPSNDFMGQEPGTNAEIKEFCRLRFGVGFPMFAKIRVKGDDRHPLYRYLTEHVEVPGPVSWNFNKFLVDRRGRVIARFGSNVAPDSPELSAAIEAALGASGA